MEAFSRPTLLEKKMTAEIHEHPWVPGQYHEAVWVKTWAGSGTNEKPPEDAPIQCAICGRFREDL